MKTKAKKGILVAAAAAWTALVIYAGAFFLLGVWTSPKIFLDKTPKPTEAEYDAFLSSPLFHLREILTPVWSLNRFVVPTLVIVAVALTATAIKRQRNEII